MVHYEYGGECNAAVIAAFWEDQSLARLVMFPARGGDARPIARAEKGQYGDDIRWHTLEECKDVAMEAQAVPDPRLATAAFGSDDPWGNGPTPEPAEPPKKRRTRGPNKPKG